MDVSSRVAARARVGVAAVLIALAAGPIGAQRPVTGIPSSADHKTIVHTLNRLGFGPAPGDVALVRQMGLAAYIEQQLHPSRIADEAMAARLAGFETLAMSTQQLGRDYSLGQMQRRQAQGAPAGNVASVGNAGDPDMRGMPPQPGAAAAGPEGSRRSERLVLAELAQQKILRAAYSKRQLEEVMVDFWFNHFNVFAGKGPTRVYLAEYERDTIRPRVLGRFRDLLGAVAQSPAMLFYLDNWQSAAAPGAGTPAAMRGRRRGINENYARELMELHTLGVDGGYTQQDVQEIARAFTGWTIEMPRQGGGFRFDPRVHDHGAKTVLGVAIPRGGGRRDGEQVLDLLAKHPATATFIATKLARRFVADEPPKALVERAAARFRETDGDIREVVRAIITSPEFFGAASYRAKVKTPLEFVASAVRASGIDVRNGLPLVQAMRQLGMPLYMCQPPTGYADRADAWVNTGALLNRMNFAVTLSGNRLRGPASPHVAVEQIAAEALAGDLSRTTTETVSKATKEPEKLALLLGSPDFQKR